MCLIDLVLRQGLSIDHLTDLLRSNPRYVFTCDLPARERKVTRHEAKQITYRWFHKRYEGKIKLRKKGGVFWAEVTGDNEGQLTGSFVAWLINNAGQIVDRIDIHVENSINA